MTLDKNADLIGKDNTSEYLTFSVNNVIFAIEIVMYIFNTHEK